MEDKTLYGIKGMRESFYASAFAFGNKPDDEVEIEYQKFLNRHPEFQSKPLTPDEVANVLADYFNSFSSKEAALIERMECQHRTLQQSFTKFVFKWIEHIAKPLVWKGDKREGYGTDGRNQASQETAQKLMRGWEMQGETHGIPPSGWLPMV